MRRRTRLGPPHLPGVRQEHGRPGDEPYVLATSPDKSTTRAFLEQKGGSEFYDLLWEKLGSANSFDVISRFDGRRDDSAGGRSSLWVRVHGNAVIVPWMSMWFPLGNASSTTAELAACASLCSHMAFMSRCFSDWV